MLSRSARARGPRRGCRPRARPPSAARRRRPIPAALWPSGSGPLREARGLRRCAAAQGRGGDWCRARTVIGRSVLSRNVRHGTPRNVLSSWTPPESVNTPAAPATRLRNSRYPSGSSRRTPGDRNASPWRSMLAAVRGWIGKATGISSATRSSARTASASSGPSTSDGRCRVTSRYSSRASRASRARRGPRSSASWPRACRSSCCPRHGFVRRRRLRARGCRGPPGSG